MIVAQTTIQVDGAALITGATTIAGGIITAAIAVFKLWVAYARDRDEKYRTTMEKVTTTMDSWQRQTIAREEVMRADNKANSDALLAVARETVKVETLLVEKTDQVIDALNLRGKGHAGK